MHTSRSLKPHTGKALLSTLVAAATCVSFSPAAQAATVTSYPTSGVCTLNEVIGSYASDRRGDFYLDGSGQSAETRTWGRLNSDSPCNARSGYSVEAGHYEFEWVNGAYQYCQTGYSGVSTTGYAIATSTCGGTSKGYSSNAHSFWVSGTRHDYGWFLLCLPTPGTC